MGRLIRGRGALSETASAAAVTAGGAAANHPFLTDIGHFAPTFVSPNGPWPHISRSSPHGGNGGFVSSPPYSTAMAAIAGNTRGPMWTGHEEFEAVVFEQQRNLGHWFYPPPLWISSSPVYASSDNMSSSSLSPPGGGHTSPSFLNSPSDGLGGRASASSRECKFCRNNGEAFATFSSHRLRCPVTNRLICPVLRRHVCEICGATGDAAHTRNYCPQLSVEEKLRRSLASQLHKTKRQANGIRTPQNTDFNNEM